MNRNDRAIPKPLLEWNEALEAAIVHVGEAGISVPSGAASRARFRLKPLCASLLLMGMVATLGQACAQTLSLTSANPSYNVGNTSYSITGLTVADNVNGVITGAGGTLNYSGGSPFALGSTTGGSTQNLDMSGLSNFIFNNATQSFAAGGQYGGSGNSSNTSATLTLAANNIITTSSFNIASIPNNAANAVRNVGAVNLGASTTINADTFNVGSGAKDSGTLTLAAGGALVLRGTNGSDPVANWNIGVNGASSLQPTTGSVNLSGGSIDALVSNILIGQVAGGSQATTGTLTLGSGTLGATSMVLGQTAATTGVAVAGTLTIGSATVSTQTLTLGNHLSTSGTVTATVNLNGGALLAQTIQSGAGTATRTFNWNNGTIGNYASGENMTVSIPGITLASGGAQTFDIEGAGATATASSVLSGAGGFTKAGAGMLALTGSSTYTGGTTVTGGLINFQSLSNLGTGNITLNGGGLQWASGNTVDVSARLNSLGVNGATFDTNGNNVTLAGNLSGAGGSLIKDGAGVLVLTGTNTYDGGTQINAGTLQLGNGGATGSIVGNIVDNSQLTVVRSGTLTLPGVISGSGSVGLTGAGTTILTADNTYTGGTLIASGTLQLGDGGTTGSIVGNVVDGAVSANASLAIDQSGIVTLPGNISGLGALNQIGTGTTVLMGTNTYTGGTTISAGTLQLGNGGTTGSIVGDVTDNGTLAFDRSDAPVYAGVISGTGLLTQIGSGTTVLTGDNTYTGGTTISTGTLQLGNGGTTGSIVGDITDNGGLAFNRSDSFVYAGVISGAGSLAQLGSGTTVLTGDNTYTGGTTIGSGALQLGNGGTTGSVVGDITNDAALVVDQSDTVTLPGVISGTGSLTQIGSGTTVLTGNNTYTGGTTISAGTLQLGNGGTTGSVVGDVTNDAVLVVDQSDTVTLSGVISGTGSLTQIGSGTTVLTGNNTYTGGTTISAGTLQLGNGSTTGSVVGDVTDNGMLAFNRADTVVYSNVISGAGGLVQLGPGTLQLEGAQTYTGPTAVQAGTLQIDGSIQSDTTAVAPGATLSGFGNIYADVTNQGTVWPGKAVAGDTNYGPLTIHGNYIGQGGVLELNTYLGTDGSPSDALVIDGGAGSGSTDVVVHNTASRVGETSGNGILVVSAVNGGTTTPDAFSLISETRNGALDYELFRGGVDGTDPDSWYLRNDFTVPPVPPLPPEPPTPPIPPLPPDPPPDPLPPGVYPIIGPEVATYGAVQPVARQLGLLTLGTMDQRIGDSALMASTSVDTDHGPSAWARLYASNINNTYQAFAAPRVNGNLAGLQVGADIWQGELIPGQSDRFGGYVSYGHADVSVRGLVTNADATAYDMQHTGSLTLNQTTAGAYWTHYGSSGWYLDGVLQVSTYSGSASTENARLDTNGVGFIASLEYGYPFSLPQLGSSFVLEPQAQAVWQRVRFDQNNDGLGEVALGTTNGMSGRLGLRGKWSMTSEGGQLWEPYAVVNFWRDGGAHAATNYGDVESVPLLSQANRAELDGGVTARLLARLNFYGSIGYQRAFGNTTNAQREGFNGDIGLRYTW